MSDFPSNPCATCGACCTSYLVPVCGYDVWRISTSQRLAPEQFLFAYPQPDSGPEGFQFSAGGQRYMLALDKKGQVKPTQPCVFLMQMAGGQSRCGIYAHRPVVCQSYPMSVWANTIYRRRDVLCPPNSWPEYEPRRPAWRAALQRWRMHYDIYYEIVARWNARVDTLGPRTGLAPADFFAYLINVYTRLDALDRVLSEETVAGAVASWPSLPRPDLNLDELRASGEVMPWFDYLTRVRQIIDTFYPEIPSQPILTLVGASMEMPENGIPELPGSAMAPVSASAER